MTLSSSTIKATCELPAGNDPRERIRRAAAVKLATFHFHSAGGGSEYWTIGGKRQIKVRFADHDEVSRHHELPDYECVNRAMTAEEVAAIESEVDYPSVVKKTAMAMHLGLTLPKLRKLLSDDGYEQVCERKEFPNTYVQYVIVAKAVRAAEERGIIERRPVAQETWSSEDFDGRATRGWR